MKIKFNKFERVAGLFVGAAIVGSLVVSLGVAIKKGWFASKVEYEAMIDNAEGIHEGTSVQVAGIRAGSVTDIELIAADKIKIQFNVFEKFQDQIREDSKVQIVRPFIIGDKVLEVSIGSDNKRVAKAGSILESQHSFDIMDLFSGRKLGPVIGTIEKLTENLKVLAEAFSDPKRTEALVKMFDRLDPLVKNLNEMSIEVVKITNIATRNKRLESILVNLAGVSEQLNKILPAFSSDPEMGKHLAQIVRNLDVLTSEFQKLVPAIQTIAPELPRTSQRAVEALDETVVLLKAMQKSFLLKGKVQEVREEESKREPAAVPKD